MRRMIGVITALMLSQAAATAEPQQIDLDVPSTTVAATVQINVKPSKGAVLLYTGPRYDKPIRFPGPSSTRVVPTSSRTVRIELVEGAKSFRVKILGRISEIERAIAPFARSTRPNTNSPTTNASAVITVPSGE